ncbi:CDP-glycerol glycerophosphotransferase family protein [Vagococcus sp.]|uniref:CDP-glycerol glycerophosphotransferase family protein n=1 Tax=Vagococcus sp. TaxID=1933889 RepID=UPI003F982C47
MGLTNNIKRLVTPALRPVLSKTGKIVDRYTQFYKTETIEKKTFFYESRDGQSMTDSPLAIFEYLLEKDFEKEYQHIWCYVPSDEMSRMMENYAKVSNVTFVERNSEDYLRWLNRAEYLINNATFQEFVSIKKEQTYINTWHGTPLKTMGFDIPGNPSGSKNVVRNFYMADYLLSPNPHTTEMFLDSFRLRDGYEGKILESGYPRIDQTFSKNFDDLLKRLFEFKVQIDLSKKILLYTPTWKGSNVNNARNDIEQIHQEMTLIRTELGDDYNVLVKIHPFLYKKAKEYLPLKPYLIPDCLDTNKVLGIVDVLVTDYSSIFFDYLVTDRPILFYCWDDDLYTTGRGQYFAYDELPGPVSFTISHLIDNLKNLAEVTEQSRPNYERFKTRFTKVDDGLATKRYLDYILYGEESEKLTIIDRNQEKEKLLFYGGGMRSNGITSSFLNLIQNIDFTRYDVTCILDQPRTKDQINNISALPRETHLLFRFGHTLYSRKEAYLDLYFTSRGMTKYNQEKYPEVIYEREASRLLGKQTFIAAIDFSGYSFFWSKLILASPAQKHFCYMHSDMASDKERVVNGRKIHKVNLNGLFSVYHRFDQLVSVSEITRDTNREKLAKYALPEQFSYSVNTINPDRILGKETEPVESSSLEPLKTKIKVREATLDHSLSEPVTLHDARPDFSYSEAFSYQFYQPDVMTLGYVELGETIYYKISQDNRYLGWINGEHLTVFEDKVIAREAVSYYGSIATRYFNDIFSEPVGLETSNKLSNARYLRNLYVQIPEVVTTYTTQSVPIILKGKQLGWIPLSNIRLSNRFNGTGNRKHLPLKMKLGRGLLTPYNHFKNRKKIREIAFQPTKSQPFGRYLTQLNQQDILGYRKPNKEMKAENLGQLDKVYIESLVTNYQGGWYVLKLPIQGRYFIPKESVELVELTATEIYVRQTAYYMVNLVSEQVTVYGNEEAILSNNGTLVQAIPTAKVLEELITTNDETYLLLQWADKQVWVSEAETEKSDATGMLNNQGNYIPYPDHLETNFVTMGRLSPEKNQIMLVEAFAEYYKEKGQGRLYLIGSGPEEEKLREKVAEEQLEEQVIFTGQMSNPFGFIAKCDIFMLTSFYEGQPMVLLEAMTLGKKIISTDIPACRYVLEDGAYGYLSKSNDVIGIKDSMLAVTEDELTFKVFDPYAYNRQAVEEFYQLLAPKPKEV